MRILGEISLLIVFVASGYAAFACLAGDRNHAPRVRQSGLLAACVALLGLTVTLAVLLSALWTRDFSFDYVARYSSQKLPWRFALSAVWVGQAGSLLLWSWLTAGLAAIFRFARATPRRVWKIPRWRLSWPLSVFCRRSWSLRRTRCKPV